MAAQDKLTRPFTAKVDQTRIALQCARAKHRDGWVILGEVEMRFFNVKIQVGGREAQCIVKEGVLATMEVGSHVDKTRQRPRHKVSVLMGEAVNGPAAWVQVASFDSDGKLAVDSEGWITSDGGVHSIASFAMSPLASFDEIDAASEDAVKCAEEAHFGPLACCTSYGNGCYVTCCGGCCSDPYGCPGASCCG